MAMKPQEPRSALNYLAYSIASILCGGGIIALVNYLSPVPLLDILLFGLYFLMPVTCLAFACGLISWGTVTAIWNPALKGRIQEYMEEIKGGDRSGRPDRNHAEGDTQHKAW